MLRSLTDPKLLQIEYVYIDIYLSTLTKKRRLNGVSFISIFFFFRVVLLYSSVLYPYQYVQLILLLWNE